MKHRAVLTSLLGSLLVGLPSLGHAQRLEARLDFGLSHARPPADIQTEGGSYLLAGGRLFAGPFFGSLHGGLAPDAGAGSWASGALGLHVGRTLSSRVAASLALIGSAFTLGDPTPYRAALGRAMPQITLSAGSLVLRLRGHGGVGRSEVLEVASDLWTFGGGLELGHHFPDLSVRIGGDLYESRDGTYRAAYVEGGGPLGLARWALVARLWDTPGDLEPQLELNLALPIGGRWSAEVTGGRGGPDPLLESPAAVSGSFLLSWDVTGTGRGSMPVYTVERRPGRTVVVFRLRRADASRVSLVGDFSGWQPIPMERVGGVWQARLPVPPGLYHFGFLVDGEWHVPPAAPGQVTDEFGRRNATLVVQANVASDEP